MKLWKEIINRRGRQVTIYHANFVCGGKRHRPQADSKTELDEIIDAIKESARKEKYGVPQKQAVITIGELYDARAKDFDETNRTHRQIKSVLLRFLKFIGRETSVRSVKKADMKRYVQWRRLQNPELKPNTINYELNRVNALFNQSDTYFSELEDWKSPRMPFEPLPQQGRERLIREDEQARLFFELRAPAGIVGTKHRRRELPREISARNTVADLFEFALLTGLRNTEARTVTIPQVDWTVKTYDGDVTVYGELSIKGKGGKKRRVPLNRDARELLERRLEESCGNWFFPNSEKDGPISQTVVYRILRRKAKDAGVKYGRKLEDGFVMHDGRHTAVTTMLQGSQYDLKTVGAIVGHSDETMTMRYAHPTEERRAGAISQLKKASKSETLNKK